MSAVETRLGLVDHMRARVVRESRLAPGGDAAPELARLVEHLLDEERHILPDAERVAVVQAVVDEALGLGPLESLLRDPTVTEVMVNGPDRVFVERAGRLQPATVRFADSAHVMHVIDRILSPLGRRVDEASPMVDARLADGSRVNAVIPPLALDGPVLTVRRFTAEPLDGDDLVRLGTLTTAMLAGLRTAVQARRNMLVTGGTGSGKTTTLAALAAVIPPAERVITIEDAAELRLALPHVVRLESRPAGIEGRGAVSIRSLVRNALRMRPDRIIVGEVRGGESLDMLQALSTGHAGSLSTLHASSPADGLRRLATLALMADIDLPYRAVAEAVASAIHLVIHQARLPDGSRRVVEVAAVGRGEDGPQVTPLVRWRASGRRDGLLQGAFEELPAATAWRREVEAEARVDGAG